MPLLSYYASVPGTTHVALGLPDQDAFALSHLRGGWTSASVNCDGKVLDPVRGGEFLIAAVADGLGSKEHPEIGACEAASTAVAALSLAVATRRDLSEIDDLELYGTLHTALMAVERKAAELSVDAEALATTLAVVAWDGERAVYAVAGDSGFVGRMGDGSYRCLGEMARAGSRTSVYPLSACTRWQVGKADGIDAIVAATDGMLEQLWPGYMTSTEAGGVGIAFDEPPVVTMDELSATVLGVPPSGRAGGQAGTGMDLGSSHAGADASEVHAGVNSAKAHTSGEFGMNKPLLDLLLDISPEDACRPAELTSGAEDFLKSLDPLDVYDDKTIVVLYKTPDAVEDDALDPDFASDEKLEAADLLEPVEEDGGEAIDELEPADEFGPAGEIAAKPKDEAADECDGPYSKSLGRAMWPATALAAQTAGLAR